MFVAHSFQEREALFVGYEHRYTLVGVKQLAESIDIVIAILCAQAYLGDQIKLGFTVNILHSLVSSGLWFTKEISCLRRRKIDLLFCVPCAKSGMRQAFYFGKIV